MPPPAHHLGTQVAEPVSSESRWATSTFVLDLPRLLVHKMGASQAQVHLRVVTKVDHPVRDVAGVAAPAPDAPVIVHIAIGDDRFRAHESSVRARLTAREAMPPTHMPTS
ncbi:hypothetical protein BN12_650004 [Nostocoides japonicum T1-X7]|uniref:Uncharacterized protein n=1 Tax=Nostocoides japonicum T1-X7 TaxID=1194083 RepID=A0A077M0S8_9MICO|nr:hypothetical protein BN12_650004 [Tetrasphaera japonica T1-X7]